MPIEHQWQEEIHRRLLAGDPLASEELCDRLLEPLILYLRKRVVWFVGGDETVLVDAAIDALIEYIVQPRGFDPNRGKSLFGYLCMAAHRDTLNSIKSIQRRSGRTVSLDVENDEGSWNRDIEDPHAPDGLDLTLLKENTKELQGWLQRVVPDPVERKVVYLMVEGERRTEAFAEVLGLQNLPLPEQRQRVKRVKDRLVKRLRRTRERER